MDAPSRRCSALRADGEPCRAWAVRGTDPPLCAAHGGTDAPIGAPPGNTNALKHGSFARPSTRRRLAASALDAAQARVPAPSQPRSEDLVEEAEAQAWSIETVIIDLSIKQALLSGYIHAHLDEFTVEQLGGMLRIHGQNASRLGRLLRDRRILAGESDDRWEQALHRALDEVGAELGIEL